MRKEIMLSLDIDTVDVLIEASSHHYDSSCKRLAANDGLLTKWKEQILADPLKKVSGTFREIDTTAKAAEMASYLPDEKSRRLGGEYFLKALGALRQANLADEMIAGRS